MKYDFSIIIPVFNEAENVKQLFKEIIECSKRLKGSLEIIFVDDCSTDKTHEVLRTLKPATIIRLRRNSGQSSALSAGIEYATGDVIITLDGDGQNDPADIPKMVAYLDTYDVVCGYRLNRKDTFSKKTLSRIGRVLRKMILNDSIKDAVCALRVYKKNCFDSLELHGEMHRMIPAMLKWQGYSIIEVPVNHRPRKYGQTKYNWQRTIRALLDIINVWFMQKYNGRPLHFFGTIGIFFILVSLILLSFLFISRLFFGLLLADRIWPIIATTLLTLGMQFFTFGLLSDLIIRSGQKMKYFSIKDVLET